MGDPLLLHNTGIQLQGQAWKELQVPITGPSHHWVLPLVPGAKQIDTVYSSEKCCKVRSFFVRCVTKTHFFQNIYSLLNVLFPGFRHTTSFVAMCIVFYMHKK